MSEDRKFNHQESDEQGLGVSMPFRRYRPAWAQGEVMLFAALYAFFQEHQYCGELGGGVDGDRVWMTCTCGAAINRRADDA
jgi:hypothetical protein